MKMRPLLTALLLTAVTVPAADEKQPARPAGEREVKEGTLPKNVQGFQGVVTGTVEAVDSKKVSLRVKVSKAQADAANNKAAKPEALAGMIITLTPVEVKGKDGKSVLDERASAYIKGALSGDPVTVAVRASSNGTVFRLIKVPSAGSK